MSDALFGGRCFRVFTAIDTFNRECLELHAGKQIKRADVAGILERLVTRYGQPERIQIDYGSEFVSKALDRWAYEHDVSLSFSRPGKPTDNAHIESFNGSFRNECLNVNWAISTDHRNTCPAGVGSAGIREVRWKGRRGRWEGRRFSDEEWLLMYRRVLAGRIAAVRAMVLSSEPEIADRCPEVTAPAFAVMGSKGPGAPSLSAVASGATA